MGKNNNNAVNKVVKRISSDNLPRGKTPWRMIYRAVTRRRAINKVIGVQNMVQVLETSTKIRKFIPAMNTA